MSNSRLSAEQRRFIEDMAALHVSWGMQPAAAATYSYLLLCDEPVTLDNIAETLGIAKSSVSVAARSLEQFGMARRLSEPGSKRLRYDASDCYAGVLIGQARLLGEISRLAESRARSVVSGEALRRLRYLAAFYRKMSATINGKISQLADDFERYGPDEDLK